MESLTSKSSRWLRKATAAAMILLLEAQASIARFCVSQTLADETEKHQREIWRELPLYLIRNRAGQNALGWNRNYGN